jgi:hypothetical protein
VAAAVMAAELKKLRRVWSIASGILNVLMNDPPGWGCRGLISKE